MKVYTAMDRDECLVIYDDGVHIEFTGRQIAVWGLRPKTFGDGVDFEKARMLYEEEQRDRAAGDAIGFALSASRSFKPRNKFLG